MQNMRQPEHHSSNAVSHPTHRGDGDEEAFARDAGAHALRSHLSREASPLHARALTPSSYDWYYGVSPISVQDATPPPQWSSGGMGVSPLSRTPCGAAASVLPPSVRLPPPPPVFTSVPHEPIDPSQPHAFQFAYSDRAGVDVHIPPLSFILQNSQLAVLRAVDKIAAMCYPLPLRGAALAWAGLLSYAVFAGEALERALLSPPEEEDFPRRQRGGRASAGRGSGGGGGRRGGRAPPGRGGGRHSASGGGINDADDENLITAVFGTVSFWVFTTVTSSAGLALRVWQRKYLPVAQNLPLFSFSRRFVPLRLQVPFILLVLSFTGVIAATILHRCMVRQLLKYKGWHQEPFPRLPTRLDGARRRRRRWFWNRPSSLRTSEACASGEAFHSDRRQPLQGPQYFYWEPVTRAAEKIFGARGGAAAAAVGVGSTRDRRPPSAAVGLPVSRRTRLWSYWLSFLTHPTIPRTEVYERCLPKRPVPSLAATVQAYLEASRPLYFPAPTGLKAIEGAAEAITVPQFPTPAAARQWLQEDSRERAALSSHREGTDELYAARTRITSPSRWGAQRVRHASRPGGAALPEQAEERTLADGQGSISAEPTPASAPPHAVVLSSEWRQLCRLAARFVALEGPRLQEQLCMLQGSLWWHFIPAFFASFFFPAPSSVPGVGAVYQDRNYLAEWWARSVFLSARHGLPFHSDFSVAMHRCFTPSPHGTSRAAVLIYLLGQLESDLSKHKLPPVFHKVGQSGGSVPVSVQQLFQAFHSTRVPGRNVDHWEHHRVSDDPSARYVLVIYKGAMYQLFLEHPAALKRSPPGRRKKKRAAPRLSRSPTRGTSPSGTSLDLSSTPPLWGTAPGSPVVGPDAASLDASLSGGNDAWANPRLRMAHHRRFVERESDPPPRAGDGDEDAEQEEGEAEVQNERLVGGSTPASGSGGRRMIPCTPRMLERMLEWIVADVDDQDAQQERQLQQEQEMMGMLSIPQMNGEASIIGEPSNITGATAHHCLSAEQQRQWIRPRHDTGNINRSAPPLYYRIVLSEEKVRAAASDTRGVPTSGVPWQGIPVSSRISGCGDGQTSPGDHRGEGDAWKQRGHGSSVNSPLSAAETMTEQPPGPSHPHATDGTSDDEPKEEEVLRTPREVLGSTRVMRQLDPTHPFTPPASNSPEAFGRGGFVATVLEIPTAVREAAEGEDLRRDHPHPHCLRYSAQPAPVQGHPESPFASFLLPSNDPNARAKEREYRQAERLLPSLTWGPRASWSDIRQQYFVQDPVNFIPLRVVEQAMFVVSLSDEMGAKQREEERAVAEALRGKDSTQQSPSRRHSQTFVPLFHEALNESSEVIAAVGMPEREQTPNREGALRHAGPHVPSAPPELDDDHVAVKDMTLNMRAQLLLDTTRQPPSSHQREGSRQIPSLSLAVKSTTQVKEDRASPEVVHLGVGEASGSSPAHSAPGGSAGDVRNEHVHHPAGGCCPYEDVTHAVLKATTTTASQDFFFTTLGQSAAVPASTLPSPMTRSPTAFNLTCAREEREEATPAGPPAPPLLSYPHLWADKSFHLQVDRDGFAGFHVEGSWCDPSVFQWIVDYLIMHELTPIAPTKAEAEPAPTNHTSSSEPTAAGEDHESTRRQDGHAAIALQYYDARTRRAAALNNVDDLYNAIDPAVAGRILSSRPVAQRHGRVVVGQSAKLSALSNTASRSLGLSTLRTPRRLTFRMHQPLVVAILHSYETYAHFQYAEAERSGGAAPSALHPSFHLVHDPQRNSPSVAPPSQDDRGGRMPSPFPAARCTPTLNERIPALPLGTPSPRRYSLLSGSRAVALPPVQVFTSHVDVYGRRFIEHAVLLALELETSSGGEDDDAGSSAAVSLPAQRAARQKVLEQLGGGAPEAGSWVVLAIQLAQLDLALWSRDAAPDATSTVVGALSQVFETIPLLHFRQSRSETLRCLSVETVRCMAALRDFVRGGGFETHAEGQRDAPLLQRCDTSCSTTSSSTPVKPAVVLSSILRACAAHTQRRRRARQGEGTERHVLSLFLTSTVCQQPSEFLSRALRHLQWKVHVREHSPASTTLRLFSSSAAGGASFPAAGALALNPLAPDGFGVTFCFQNAVGGASGASTAEPNEAAGETRDVEGLLPSTTTPNPFSTPIPNSLLRELSGGSSSHGAEARPPPVSTGERRNLPTSTTSEEWRQVSNSESHPHDDRCDDDAVAVEEERESIDITVTCYRWLSCSGGSSGSGAQELMGEQSGAVNVARLFGERVSFWLKVMKEVTRQVDVSQQHRHTMDNMRRPSFQ